MSKRMAKLKYALSAVMCAALVGLLPGVAQGQTFLQKWGTQGGGSGQFGSPTDVEVDAAGNIYVADQGNGLVQKLDSNGAFVTQWGGIAGPGGVAVDAASNVFTSALHSNLVYKHDTDGNPVTTWTVGSGKWGIGGPDAAGNVYVAVNSVGQIWKYDSSGTLLFQLGTAGSGDGQFSDPRDVEVDTAGNIYVADNGNCRVQKFDSSGNFLTKWGSCGSGDGQFNFLIGISVDTAGNVYTAEYSGNRVQVFDSNGNFITKWGSTGSGDGQFSTLAGIAVDANGYVYTAEQSNWRIQKFSPVVIVPPTNEDQKITASDATSGDQFGFSVSVSGNRAVSSARKSDAVGADAGAVYVYDYSGGTWSETAKLTASDAQSGDQFGYSAAISGNRIAVGAEAADGTFTDMGSAYVYEHNGSAWVETAKLTASDAAASDYFGHSIAISGDRIVVGAYTVDTGGISNTGAAYVFEYNGSAWVETAKLTASDGGNGHIFGQSVSIDGDRIVVGASGWGIGSNHGSAYVFDYNGSAWVEVAQLTASDAGHGDNYGYDVSVSGDRVLVGGYANDDAGNNSGSAYVYDYNGSAWVETVKLTASDAAADDGFGYKLSLSGDRAVIGSSGDDDGGSNAGAAYVYEYDGSAWNEVSKLVASDAAADAALSWTSVSLVGNRAMIGTLSDEVGTNSGSMYYFSFGPEVVSVDLRIRRPPTTNP